jgi:hypothetical protein
LMPQMHINIVDNRLVAPTGHHFDICHGIARALAQIGINVRVLGNQRAPEEVVERFRAVNASFFRTFSHYSFAGTTPDQHAWGSTRSVVDQMVLETGAVEPSILNVFPSLTPEQLWAHSLCDRAPPMVGMVHWEPDFQNPHGGSIWNAASELIAKRGLQVSIGAIDPIIGDYLQTYSDHVPITSMPVPHGGIGKSSYPIYPETIGFFGHQRPERGSRLIPDLVGELLALGYGVVLHDTRGQFQRKGTPSKLRLLNGFVEDLCSEMAACDLIVCPMDRQSYAQRLSGIVCHAVAAGVPFVLPSGTLSAVRFNPLGSSCCYAEPHPPGIMNAIQKVASDYPKYSKSALEGSKAWNAQHGVDKFVWETILDVRNYAPGFRLPPEIESGLARARSLYR